MKYEDFLGLGYVRAAWKAVGQRNCLKTYCYVYSKHKQYCIWFLRQFLCPMKRTAEPWNNQRLLCCRKPQNTSGQGTLSLRALTQPFLKFVINLKSKFKPIRLPLNWLFLFQRLQQRHSCAEGTNVNNFHHVSYSYLRTHSGKDRKGAEGVRKIGGL